MTPWHRRPARATPPPDTRCCPAGSGRRKLLVEAYRRPEVPYGAGPEAVRLGATAMIDVSDGLVADLGHIAEASAVGIDLRKEAFTVPAPMRDAATALGVDPYTWILAGGDDHAFVATFPAGTALPDTWTVVGQVLPASLFPGEGITVDGRRWTNGAPGWDHFRSVAAALISVLGRTRTGWPDRATRNIARPTRSVVVDRFGRSRPERREQRASSTYAMT